MDCAFPGVSVSADQPFLNLLAPRPLLGLLSMEKLSSIVPWVNTYPEFSGYIGKSFSTTVLVCVSSKATLNLVTSFPVM